MPYKNKADEAAWKSRRWKRVHEMLRKLREAPCTDCKRSYPWYVMEFDHVRGKKSFVLGNHGSISLNKVLAELEKCDLVCGNCHNIRTHERR